MRGRRVLIAIAALLIGGAATAVALDRLFPPDLGRASMLSTLVVDRGGAPVRLYPAKDGQYRLSARAADVDPRYLELLVAYEDARFHRHPGVDPLAIVRAAGQWIARGRVVSGASTLTMQVVRLLEPRPRTLGAKAIESFRALQLEARFSKEEILDLYLTLAPFGGNLQGIQAASLAYLGKAPAELTLAEAAMLVALPQAPTARRPDTAPGMARAGQQRVLDRLVASGAITPTEAREAMEAPPIASRRAFAFHAPHLADRLARQAPADGVIRTTLDLPVQQTLEALARREVAGFDDGGSIAIIVVETASRAVRAWIGGPDFFGRQGQIDLARAVRSPGSALKPLIYGLAFDDLAVLPDTRIDDLPQRFGDWAPRNFDREFRGAVTVRQALQQSLNLPAVAVLDRIGAHRFQAALAQAGVAVRLPRPGASAGLPVALGGGGITLADLVTLYAGIADRGQVRALRLLDAAPEGAGVKLLTPTAAHYLTQILADAPRPDMLSARSDGGTARRIAYKTGTSYGFRDAWAIGWSATHTVGVWVGRADGTPRPGAYGRNTAAPVLFKAFDLIPGNRGLADDPAPLAAAVAMPQERLPSGLRRFRGHGTDDREAVLIAFPPDGATVEAGRDATGALAPLGLEAHGGNPPYRWLVNDRPLADADRMTEALWTPDGEGFARIVVVDARGRSARADIRVK